MSMLSTFTNIINKTISSPFFDIVRYASKKSRTSTRISPKNLRPKHRGIKVTNRKFIEAGSLIATQLKLRFYPGLNVCIGRDGSLIAMERGEVHVTCEKVNPDWSKRWVKLSLAGRENQDVYKKYCHVVPLPQHRRFKLIDEI